MAGSGRHPGRDPGKDGTASTGNTVQVRESASMTTAGQNLSGGFDGPSDAQSLTGRPAHGFGSTLGYDPARDDSGPKKPQFSTMFELPSDAFRDPKTQVSFKSASFAKTLPICEVAQCHIWSLVLQV